MFTFSKLGSYGRLGNMLFQIASTIGIALKHNSYYYFPYFEGHADFRTNLFDYVHAGSLFKIYQEPHFHYKDVVLDTEYSWDLIGYFQSEEYFKHCEETIRQKFLPSLELEERVNRKHGDIINLQNTVAIHVRRGDYLTLTDYHSNLSLTNYYALAKEKIESIIQHPQYVFFSDDINWVMSQDLFKSFCPATYVLDKTENSVYHVFLMSQCKHFIIANSSFSWWAAWLSQNKDKMVIAPSQWFGPLGPQKHDLYCKNWVII